jgi:hypothetical protein
LVCCTKKNLATLQLVLGAFSTCWDAICNQHLIYLSLRVLGCDNFRIKRIVIMTLWMENNSWGVHTPPECKALGLTISVLLKLNVYCTQVIESLRKIKLFLLLPYILPVFKNNILLFL